MTNAIKSSTDGITITTTSKRRKKNGNAARGGDARLSSSLSPLYVFVVVLLVVALQQRQRCRCCGALSVVAISDRDGGGGGGSGAIIRSNFAARTSAIGSLRGDGGSIGGGTLLVRRFASSSSIPHGGGDGGDGGEQHQSQERAPADATGPEAPPRTAEDVREKKEQAISSMTSCYRIVFWSLAADVATAAWFVRTAPSRSRRLLELARALWKVAFGAGLYRMTDFLSSFRGDEAPGPDLVDAAYRIMGRLWRQSSVLIMMASGVDLGTNFRDVVPFLRPKTYALLALVGAVLVGSISMRQTSSLVPDSHLDATDGMTTEKKLSIVASNMALCVGALLFRGGIVMPLVALTQPTPIAKIRGFVDASTPFVAGTLLWQLRANAVELYRSVLENRWDPAEQNYRVFDGQQKFYKQVFGVMRSEIVAKVLLVIGPVLKDAARKLRAA